MHDCREQERAAIILAGGEGAGLKSVTESIAGRPIPKQYCPLLGGETLLSETRRRISLSIRESRTLTVVTRAHKEFYDAQLANTDPSDLVVQPGNRGTAPAILYALLRLRRLGSNAAVAIFPSNQYVSDDPKFMSYVEDAFESLQTFPDLVILLGVTPDNPDMQYGWIEGGDPVTHSWSFLRQLQQVRRFFEKPSIPLANNLYRRGCLWNSGVLVGNVQVLLALYRRALPHLYRSFIAIRPTLGTAFEQKATETLYGSLLPTNLSGTVLANFCSWLAVLPVSGLVWSDVATPGRLRAVLRRIGGEPRSAMVPPGSWDRPAPETVALSNSARAMDLSLRPAMQSVTFPPASIGLASPGLGSVFARTGAGRRAERRPAPIFGDHLKGDDRSVGRAE